VPDSLTVGAWRTAMLEISLRFTYYASPAFILTEFQ